MNKNISLSGIKEDVFQLGLMVEDGGLMEVAGMNG